MEQAGVGQDAPTLTRLPRILRSAGFARGALVFLGAYAGIAAWLPWTRDGGPPPPAWATAIGLDHPFSAVPFLAGVAALFASTLACTWGKRARTAAAWRGAPPGMPLRLDARSDRAVIPFLRSQGFRGAGPVLFRNRFALWGGWVLHVGLLVLMAGVVAQQALHDGANFQLIPGERRRLSDPGAVFQRERGPLAPASPPDVDVALLEFDPFQHQPGYAPDRASVVSVAAPGEEPVTQTVDRASGVRVRGVEIFQAIPTGLAAVIETPSHGRVALHLASRGPRAAFAELHGQGGQRTRFVVEAEHDLHAPGGTGALQARLEQGDRRLEIRMGQPFALGGEPARLVAFARWAGFTYSRSPGMPLVYAGFALVLVGATLLAFPAGVARLADAERVAEVWLARGGDALARRWAEPARGGAD